MSSGTLARLSALLVLAGAAALLQRVLDLGLLLDPEGLAVRLAEAGASAPLLFMALMALVVVVSPLPSLPLDLAAGLAFGPWWGTLFAATGALAGSLVAFGIARLLGRALVERFLAGHIDFCRECSDKLLGKVVFLSRLVPVVSFDVVSYGAGLTAMSPRSFALATFFGTLPLTFVYVSSGAVLAVGPGPALALGAVLVGLFFLLPRWIERRNPFGLGDVFTHASGPDRLGAQSGESP